VGRQGDTVQIRSDRETGQKGKKVKVERSAKGREGKGRGVIGDLIVEKASRPSYPKTEA